MQLRLLGVLRDREPGMLELAGILGLEKSSVTGLIDRAQRRGLVERIGSEHDGRAVHVRPTPDGRAVARRGVRLVAMRLAELTVGLSARDQAALERLAGHVIGADAARRVDLAP